MAYNHLKISVPCMTMILLSSCIDSGYDLANIDTTTQIRVNDLILPINIDKITLDNVIDLDENDNIKKIDINGETFYAITESGEFHSNPIKIGTVIASAPAIEKKSVKLHGATSSDPFGSTSEVKGFPITKIEKHFTYKFSDVDKSIYSIKNLATQDLNFKITLSIPEDVTGMSKMKFKNLVISIPKGLEASTNVGEYNPTTGLLTIPDLQTTTSSTTIDINIQHLDLETNASALDYDSHSMEYTSNLNIESGELYLYPSADVSSLPDNITFESGYKLSDFKTTKFDGDVNYNINGVNISPINLSNIPSFLAQEGTNILLANPQIYLQINNPLAEDALKLQTGVTLTANRSDKPSQDYTLDNSYFTIGYDKGSGPYNYCLSPYMPSSTPDEFSNNITHIPYSSLSEVLAGSINNGTDKIPNTVDITLDNPQIPLQRAKSFKLGTQIAGINGKYEFYSPLSLKDGSVIVYSDTEDGWSNEDVAAITIEKLSVSANVTSSLPSNLYISAEPIDTNGNVINNVTIEGGNIDAFANEQQLNIYITGEIRDLDGIRFKAYMYSSSEQSFAPDQQIKLDSIRAHVSGYYTKEL
jgi:hypothetical protein